MVDATLTFLREKFTILSELAGEGGGEVFSWGVELSFEDFLVFFRFFWLLEPSLDCCWLFKVVWEEEEERLVLEFWVFLEGVAMVSYSFFSQ